MEDSDILIKIKAMLDKASFTAAKEQIHNIAKITTQEMKKATPKIQEAFQLSPAALSALPEQLSNDLSQFTNKDLKQFEQRFQEIQSLALPEEMFADITNNFNKMDPELVKLLGTTRAFNLAIKETEKGTKWAGRVGANSFRIMRTSLVAMSVTLMLIGRLFTRFFTSMWKQSNKVFNDVMHSVSGSITGFDRLNSGITFLQYAIGAALEPVAGWLAGIVWIIAEWINENKGVARTLLLVIGGLGVLFTVLGFVSFVIVNTAGAVKVLSAAFAAKSAVAIKGAAGEAVANTAVATTLKAKLAVLGLVALKIVAISAAILLVIGIITIWQNIVKALKIRWEQLKNYFSWFFTWLAVKMLKAGLKMREWALSIKEFFAPAINWLGEKFADTLNLIIAGINRVRAFLGATAIPTVEFKGIDVGDIQKERNEIEKTRQALDAYYQLEKGQFSRKAKNLSAQLKLNRIDAGEKLWGDLFKKDVDINMEQTDILSGIESELEEINSYFDGLTKGTATSSAGAMVNDNHVEIHNPTFEVYANNTNDLMRELERKINQY